jgi:hypothetical protein
MPLRHRTQERFSHFTSNNPNTLPLVLTHAASFNALMMPSGTAVRWSQAHECRTHARQVAGHDTTSFMMASALYFLAANPEAKARLVAEVDSFGRQPPEHDDLEQFPYVEVTSTLFQRGWGGELATVGFG